MFTFQQWLTDYIVKAAGHKYIKRIPYQRGGKLRYRYVYKVGSRKRGKGLTNEAHIVPRAKFMFHTASGAEIHGEVVAVSGDKVTILYDDGPKKGQKETLTRARLANILEETHGDVVSPTQKKSPRRGAPKQRERAPDAQKDTAAPQSETKEDGAVPSSILDILETYKATPSALSFDSQFPLTLNQLAAPDKAYRKQLIAFQNHLDREGKTAEEFCDQHNQRLAALAEDFGRAGLWDYTEKLKKYNEARDAGFPDGHMWPPVAPDAVLKKIKALTKKKKLPSSVKVRAFAAREGGSPSSKEVGAIESTVAHIMSLYPEYSPKEIRIAYHPGANYRANCRPEDPFVLTINMPTGRREKEGLIAAVHEAIHCLENNSDNARFAVLASTVPRIKKGKHEAVADGRELAFSDEFYHPYTGKMYESGASEYLTMGGQILMNNDIKASLNLAALDPHHFLTTFGVLTGAFK